MTYCIHTLPSSNLFLLTEVGYCTLLVPSCMEEHTAIKVVVSVYWPVSQIGQRVSANCTCGDIIIGQASRFCGGDITTEATWDNPDVSACDITETERKICELILTSVSVL